MRCNECARADYAPGVITHTDEQGSALVVVRNVPALVCPTCGDHVFESGVVGPLNAQISASYQEGVTMVVRDFVSAPLSRDSVKMAEAAEVATIAGGA